VLAMLFLICSGVWNRAWVVVMVVLEPSFDPAASEQLTQHGRLGARGASFGQPHGTVGDPDSTWDESALFAVS